MWELVFIEQSIKKASELQMLEKKNFPSGHWNEKFLILLLSEMGKNTKNNQTNK